MLKPRYNLTLDASCLLIGRAGKYDVWVEPAGIVTVFSDGSGTTAAARHTWARFRSHTFRHWPENLKLKLRAYAAMMEERT